MKKLQMAVVAGSLAIAGGAYAVPQDGDGKSDQKIQASNGTVYETKHIDQATAHPVTFNGDPTTLEQAHPSFNQSQHMRSMGGGGEATSEARDGAAGQAKSAPKSNKWEQTTGFAGAKNQMQKADKMADVDHASRSPNNSTDSDKATDEMGDIAPSGGGTGDKHINQAAVQAQHTFIANDFSSAKQLNKDNEKADLQKQDSKMHIEAGKAQQLTQGDSGENSERGNAAVGEKVINHDPQMGTHNNFVEAKERVGVSDSYERMSKVHTPDKFFH
jgi:hypothetical protein